MSPVIYGFLLPQSHMCNPSHCCPHCNAIHTAQTLQTKPANKHYPSLVLTETQFHLDFKYESRLNVFTVFPFWMTAKFKFKTLFLT